MGWATLTLQTPVLNAGDIKRCAALGTARARFALECNSRAQEAYKEQTGEIGISLPDPVAMAIALEPALATEASVHYCDVEIASDLTRGMTVVDRLNAAANHRNRDWWRGFLSHPPNVSVVELSIYRAGKRFYWRHCIRSMKRLAISVEPVVLWIAWWYPFVFRAPHVQKRPSITVIGRTRIGLAASKTIAFFCAFFLRLAARMKTPGSLRMGFAGRGRRGRHSHVLGCDRLISAVSFASRQASTRTTNSSGTGPYALVRHPIYAAMLCLLLSTMLLVTPWVWWPLPLALFVIGTEIRVRCEDGLLAGRFGAKFDEYRRATSAYALARALGRQSPFTITGLRTSHLARVIAEVRERSNSRNRYPRAVRSRTRSSCPSA